MAEINDVINDVAHANITFYVKDVYATVITSSTIAHTHMHRQTHKHTAVTCLVPRVKCTRNPSERAMRISHVSAIKASGNLFRVLGAFGQLIQILGAMCEGKP